MNVRRLQIKNVELLTFVTLVSVFSSSSSQSRWYCNRNWLKEACNGSSSSRQCYASSDGVQRIEINKDAFKLECSYKSPYRRAVQCSRIQKMTTLTLVDCTFSKFMLKAFLENKKPKEINIEYTRSIEIELDLRFIDVLNVLTFSVKNAVAGDQFPIIFGSGSESIEALRIDGHSFKVFETRLNKLLNLKELNIRNGQLGLLTTEMLSGFGRTLITLDLSWNRINHIESTALKHLMKLKVLYLTGNLITNFGARHFSNLNNLEYLKLDTNKITTIRSGLFSSLAKLVLLDISGNHQTRNFPSGLLSGVKRLKYFFAANCSLYVIKETLFFDNIFYQMAALNSKVQLTSKILQHHPCKSQNSSSLNVSSPYLSSDDIHFVPRSSEILEVNISYNQLISIPPRTFSSLKSLQLLNISYNPLTTLPENEPFGPSANLKILAEHCRLSEIPRNSWVNKTFLHLDLSHNLISHPLLPVCLQGNVTVKLYNNDISSITLSEECNLGDEIPKYYLANNAPVCMCSLRPFLDFVLKKNPQKSAILFPDIHLLYCRENVTLEKAFMFCPEECPDSCTCVDIILNCSSNNRIYPPTSMPKHLTIVWLNDNKIKSLEKANSESWNNVTDLNISLNLLTTLDDWKIPESLKVLDVRHNNLQQIPLPLMEKVEEDFDFKIYLSFNDWWCDCKTIEFKEWFMRNQHQIKDYHYVSCKFDLGNDIITKEFIKHLSVDDFCADGRVDSRISIVILPIFFLASLVYAYYYKHTLLSLLYSYNLLPFSYFNKPVVEEKEKDYDAFIYSNVSDRDVVIQLIRKLQSNYKLHIPERDWPRKGNVRRSTLISQSLKNSRATIFLLSKQSLEEPWFQITVRAAFNQRLEDSSHRLIFVVAGSIKGVYTSNDVQDIIFSQPCLEWGERWFWHKLRYELRSPKQKK